VNTLSLLFLDFRRGKTTRCIIIVMDGELIYDQELLFGI
jgi:hypothetical protein